MEVEVKFKWQRKMIEEVEELSFDEVVDRLVNVAQLGDRMEHRDEWEIIYLIKHLKDIYKRIPFWEMIPFWEKTMSDMSVFYKCPECEHHGFPSIFGDMCTSCANTKRGYGSGTQR